MKILSNNSSMFMLFLFLGFTTFGKSTSIDSILKFNKAKDLLLIQLDCKTDVDDLQTAAAFYTLLAHEEFSNINYHAIVGTYGIQEGLYVPPNSLMDLAFSKHWTDAHANQKKAVKKVKEIAVKTIKSNGVIWIAEAGQSDFSAKVVQEILKEIPQLNTKKYIRIVQHSDWNEEVTSEESLSFVKSNTKYYKIPDGNTVGNGTSGFRDPAFLNCIDLLSDKKMITVWQLAIELSNKYNGKDKRYNNEAILSGGLDFSDLSEVCWILDLEIKDVTQFFSLYAK